MKSYLYALGTLIVLACICQDDIFVLLQPAPANEQKSAATAIVPADTAVVDTNIVEMTKETMSAYDRALPEPVKIAEKITVKNHIVINNDTAVKKVPQNVFDRSETVSLNGKTYRGLEDELIACIAYVENYFPTSYFCGARWTIGYGTTGYADGKKSCPTSAFPKKKLKTASDTICAAMFFPLSTNTSKGNFPKGKCWPPVCLSTTSAAAILPIKKGSAVPALF